MLGATGWRGRGAGVVPDRRATKGRPYGRETDETA